jgi:ABC-2 type transport system permease protein
MRGAWVIAEKDLRNIFLSPLFYIIAGVCTLTWSLLFYFSVDEFLYQSLMRMQQFGPDQSEGGLNLHFTVFAKHISLVNLLLIFAVAAVSMRLFTEEKRQRTFDLLLTAPVTATEIAMGKLIAGVGMAWALLLVSLLYPLSLAIFGQLDWGLLFSSYLGLMLLTASYASISMFTSSLTQSAVVAVVVGLIFNVMLWFVGAFSGAAETPQQRAIVDHLNVGTHFVNFIKGNVSVSGLVFFLSVICLFTFLTQRVVESSRWR